MDLGAGIKIHQQIYLAKRRPGAGGAVGGWVEIVAKEKLFGEKHSAVIREQQ